MGASGSTGATGTKILGGINPPSDNLGAIGDFYIDFSTGLMYGPKVNI
jgi:hypothetical protein